MNRRLFIKALGTVAVTAGLPSYSNARNDRRVAITIDDPNTSDTPRLSVEERNAAILRALRQHSDLKAALFVCGKRVDSVAGKRLLQTWNDNRHAIANHSYSHQYFHSGKITTEAFIQDCVRGEAIIAGLPRFVKLFRFPFLKEGNVAEKRDGMRAFLKKSGYRNGHVTIDASDWYVDERLRQRLGKEPAADLTPYRDFYLKHIWDRTTFYDNLSERVLGRSIPHTLLIHHNLLNALFLSDLLGMFKTRGWKLINAEEAFADRVFDAAPNILPAGESIIWALAKETGKFNDLLRYPGEDGKYEKAEMDKLGL